MTREKPESQNSEFKKGDKFILELGEERRMFDEFEIAGTDLYVKKDLLEKLTPYTPSAQPEITDEQAIEHLQTSGWMQNHDKQMYEMGLREQLADDSDSYDALLPSAQPEAIRINLNEPIKVKLTEWGKEIFYHQYDRINKITGREVCKPSLPKEDENGYTEFQLWEFIELYGMHMGMTLPNVIEPLEIVYDARRAERREDG